MSNSETSKILKFGMFTFAFVTKVKLNQNRQRRIVKLPAN